MTFGTRLQTGRAAYYAESPLEGTLVLEASPDISDTQQRYFAALADILSLDESVERFEPGYGAARYLIANAFHDAYKGLLLAAETDAEHFGALAQRMRGIQRVEKVAAGGGNGRSMFAEYRITFAEP